MRAPHLILLSLLALPAAAAGQSYGSTVTATGRDIFIGEPINQYSPGVVYVYTRGTGGAWREAAQLSATDGTPLDRFGRHLSVDGDRLLVGATSIDSSRGAAYVFERDRNGAWRQTAKLVPASARPPQAWGRQVLLQGDVAYVAAWGANESRGAVAVFRRGADGAWTEGQMVAASDGAPNDFFSSSFSVAGDLMLVGASQRDSARGAAYLFRRDAAGQWKEEAKLLGRGSTRNTRFGAAVAIWGDKLMVGAPGIDFGIGTVFVYGNDNGRWNEQRRLAAFDGAPNAQFGSAIGVVGGEIWVGAPGLERFSGRIYRLSLGTDGVITAAAKLMHAQTDAGDGFGSAFTSVGDVAVVGSPGDDNGVGTAAILSRGTGGWSTGVKVMGEDRTLAGVTGEKKDCAGGKVGVFDCGAVDLLAYMPVSAIGGGRGVRLNDVWGWTDALNGREYALVGRIDGTSFVDITDPVNPKYLGDLPKTAGSPNAGWRDIKVYRDHAFIVADGSARHGMQVFDLTRLRNVRGAPVTFTPEITYDKIASAHNIVIDTASGFAFAVGSNGGGETCGGALHIIDIRQPKNPTFAGCFADTRTGNQRTGYTHDAQCVVYHGPDQAYHGRQICVNSSETAIGIADVTDKANPKALSQASYPNVGYTHQGWFSDDQRYFYVDDEGDEVSGTVQGTRTLIWDLSDLDDPVLAGQYISENRASDHNLYVRGNLMYQSNYASGLRILDISDPKNPKPVGHFDTNPVGVDAPGFTGSWSNYPYFKSETIVVTSIQEGLFLVKKASRPLVP